MRMRAHGAHRSVSHRHGDVRAVSMACSILPSAAWHTAGMCVKCKPVAQTQSWVTATDHVDVLHPSKRRILRKDLWVDTKDRAEDASASVVGVYGSEAQPLLAPLVCQAA